MRTGGSPALYTREEDIHPLMKKRGRRRTFRKKIGKPGTKSHVSKEEGGTNLG